MATIYSLVTDSDAGTECELFTSEADRDARCHALCADAWSEPEPMPTDWRDAWAVISETADWWLVVQDHEIDLAQLAAQVQS